MHIANGHNKSYIKKYTLQVGEIEVYDTYIKAEINEGVTMNLETASELILISHKHFPTKPFVYITVRKNSYSVDPMVYLKVFEIENLKAIAIVSEKFIDNHNVKIEKHFFNKPMQIFKTKQEAIAWANSLL